MMAALQQQLLASVSESFFNLPFIRFDISNISIFVSRNAVKVAKLAIGDANIGGVHISINYPCYFSVRNLDLPQLISNGH